MTSPSWPEALASALIGTARGGSDPEALLDTVAAQALRRRAGADLVPAEQPPEPVPADADAAMVGPAAAARADALLALGLGGRTATPARDLAGRLALLTEWLTAAAAAGRRLPPELVPALLDAGRRHHQLRPLIPAVAGPLAGWLAAQRSDWAYALAGPVANEPEPVGNDPEDVDEVLALLAEQLSQPATSWRATGLCERAGFDLPPAAAPAVVALVDRLLSDLPRSPGLAAAERMAAIIQFRHDMLEELASDR